MDDREARRMKAGILCPDAFTTWRFYKGILQALKELGFQVYVISAPDASVADLERAGLAHIPVRLKRFISPFNDCRLLLKLYGLCRKHQFDFVHCFFLKLNLYGAMAARLARVRNVLGTVEGLGVAYTEVSGFKRRALRRLMDVLNWVAFRLADKVWFVNGDDLRECVSRNLITEERAVLIKSHGINLSEFSGASVDLARVDALKRELKVSATTCLVTMVVARAIWTKGIKEFIEAARLLEDRNRNVRFVLVAPIEEDSPEAVPSEYLRAAGGESFHWCSTFRMDIREILYLSDMVVLPSYYREGIPTVLVEAMALGKPTITTDNVGCREVVEDGKNGFLVPIKNSRALANAIMELLADEHKRREFGRYSRAKVEREFDEREIVRRVLAELYGLPTEESKVSRV